eukprot:m.286363 g.286363  ORF g.286363 m.286363 type:complete len:377 (+) comp19928_c0_seq1:391-1521(+)
MDDSECFQCGKSNSPLKHCARCKNAEVLYCSSNCQKISWSSHKLVCYKDAFNESEEIAIHHSLTQQVVLAKESSETAGTTCANLVVFLHGVGDSEKPFTKLASTMQLPQTTCLCLRGPLSLPLDMGYSWLPAFEADGQMISGTRGDKRRTKALLRAARQVNTVVKAYIAEHPEISRVLLYGFGQGAIVATHMGMTQSPTAAGTDATRGRARIHAVVAISGGCWLPEFSHAVPDRQSFADGKNSFADGKDSFADTDPAPSRRHAQLARAQGWTAEGRDTPILVCHSKQDSLLLWQQAREQYHTLKGWARRCEWLQLSGAGVPSTQKDMQGIYKFLAPKLELQSTMSAMARNPGEEIIDVTGQIDPSTVLGLQPPPEK